MKKNKLFFSLAVIFIISAFIITAEAAEANPFVRVGLYYGSAALPAANLANESGSGYEFGYFDANGYFTSLGYTSEEKITMIKDKNMYLSGSTYYDIIPSSGGTLIGAYHIDPGDVYYSFNEAAAAAANYKNATGVNSFPAYANGEFHIYMGYYASKEDADAARNSMGLGGRSVGPAVTSVLVVKTSTGEPIFEFDGGAGIWLGVMPVGSADPRTWFKGLQYRGGFEYRRVTGNDLTVINVVDMQNYAKGVLPHEMNASWPLEALKAQALCAKNYVLCNQNKHKSNGFNICNTTDCQVYKGYNLSSANSDRAVDETYGQYIYYGGNLAQTYYHSSNGGSTEDAKNVWGTDFPYLKAVPDNFETLTAANNGIWSVTYTYDQITQILKAKNHSVTKVTDVYIGAYTPAGNVLTLCIKDSSGKVLSFSREDARTILYSSTYGKSVSSLRYTIGGSGSYYINSQNGAVPSISGAYVIGKDGQTRLASETGLSVISGSGTTSLTKEAGSNPSSTSVLIEGRGWGHNVGMSQLGAKGMAERGYRFDEIIKYYFTGVTVE